jgi:hypothetical protein
MDKQQILEDLESEVSNNCEDTMEQVHDLMDSFYMDSEFTSYIDNGLDGMTIYLLDGTTLEIEWEVTEGVDVDTYYYTVI